MLINFDERIYYDSVFCKLNTESHFLENFDRKSSNEVAISKSEYLKQLQLAVKTERASAKNLLAKQGKTVSENLLQVRRQKQFSPITAEVKALQPMLKALQVEALQPAVP